MVSLPAGIVILPDASMLYVAAGSFALAKLTAKSASFDKFVTPVTPAPTIVVLIESLDAIIPFISSTIFPSFVAMFN